MVLNISLLPQKTEIYQGGVSGSDFGHRARWKFYNGLLSASTQILNVRFIASNNRLMDC